MNEDWHHILFPFFDPVYPRMEAAMELLKKFIAIHFLCVSLCLLKLNWFPKRKKKRHCGELSHQQRALRGLEDGRYLVFWRGSSFRLFLYGRHFETPLIQSHIGTQEMWPQHKHCAGFPMLECSWELWGSTPAQSNHSLGGNSTETTAPSLNQDVASNHPFSLPIQRDITGKWANLLLQNMDKCLSRIVRGPGIVTDHDTVSGPSRPKLAQLSWEHYWSFTVAAMTFVTFIIYLFVSKMFLCI